MCHLGSKGLNGVVCGIFLCVRGHNLSVSFALEALIFTEELYTLMETLRGIPSKDIEGSRCTIFSDSQSAMASKPVTITSPIPQRIRELMQKAQAENILTDICLVLGK